MLIRDDFTRRLENDRSSAFVLMAAGAEITAPDVEAELERFDMALNELPQMNDTDTAKAALRQALGLPAERTNA